MPAIFPTHKCTDPACKPAGSIEGAPRSEKYEQTCCPSCYGIGLVADDTEHPAWHKAVEAMTTRLDQGAEMTYLLDGNSGLIYQRRRDKARKILQAGTAEPWTNIRGRIWARDASVCQVCKEEIPYEHFELGHKVDRVAGGSDADDNVQVQCVLCNRLKPVHYTTDEFEQWRSLPSNLERWLSE